MNNVKKMVFTGLLIAFAIIIPIQFSFLKITIPPFTATLAAHVPMFLSMLMSPSTAIIVGIGSAIGFLLSGTPLYVVARASMHIIVGGIGALMIKKGVSFTKVIAITAPIHGVLEAIAVIPWYGINVYQLLIVVALGSIIHHVADGVITVALVKALSKALGRDISKNLFTT